MNVFMDSLVGGYTVPIATNYALLLKSMSGGVLKFAFRMRNFRGFAFKPSTNSARAVMKKIFLRIFEISFIREFAAKTT